MDATTALYFGLGLEVPTDGASELQHRPCASGDQVSGKGASANREKFLCFLKTCSPFSSDFKMFASAHKKTFILSKICTTNVDSVEKYSYNTELKLGLLTKTPIASSVASNQFYLYTDSDIVGVTLKQLGQVELTKEDLAKVHSFHSKIFSDVLQNISASGSGRFDPDKKKGIAVVPVKSKNIDWELLGAGKHLQDYKELLKDGYKSIVVVPKHRSMGCYYVKKVHWDLSPKSVMRGTETFEDYYTTKYKCQIVNRNQPLLSVSNARKIRNMLIPPDTRAKKSDSDSTILIPELTQPHDFPEMIWRESVLLPFILHRLNFLCNLSSFADELQILPHWYHNNHNLTCQLIEDTFADIISDKLQNEWLPSVGSLMSPFTLGSAGEIFSLEREEFLGDSFLKYSTTVYLFFRYAKSNEGTLTALRSRLVGNDNLCHLAKNKNIHCLLNGVAFDPTKSFLPPLYTSDEKNLLNISKKSLADIFEAIIGAVLLNCGQLKAFETVTNMGIELRVKAATRNNKEKLWGALFTLNEDENYFYHQSHKEYFQATLLNEINTVAFMAEENVLHGVEDCLDYKFQRKDFLRLAMTLAQLKSESVKQSNERLEFLGDGIIDYLVTLYLYLRFPKMSPGELTDLRSSIVNNRAFAEVAINSGLSEFLNLKDDYLQEKIVLFKESLADGELKGLSGFATDFVESALFEEETCPSFTISDPPKILGDYFESILGAIYLDSGLSLPDVWRVLRRLYKSMDDIVIKRPKQPVKELMEMFPERVCFRPPKLKSQLDGDGKTVCIAEVKPKRENEESSSKLFRGIGDNKKEARDAAAKCAVTVITLLKEQLTLRLDHI